MRLRTPLPFVMLAHKRPSLKDRWAGAATFAEGFAGGAAALQKQY
jgi:hypothetical protein